MHSLLDQLGSLHRGVVQAAVPCAFSAPMRDRMQLLLREAANSFGLKHHRRNNMWILSNGMGNRHGLEQPNPTLLFNGLKNRAGSTCSTHQRHCLIAALDKTIENKDLEIP